MWDRALLAAAVPSCWLPLPLLLPSDVALWAAIHVTASLNGWEPKSTHLPSTCLRRHWLVFTCREGTLQRFGADILERLARDKAIPRREPWGEWVMTEEVRWGTCGGK